MGVYQPGPNEDGGSARDLMGMGAAPGDVLGDYDDLAGISLKGALKKVGGAAKAVGKVAIKAAPLVLGAGGAIAGVKLGQKLVGVIAKKPAPTPPPPPEAPADVKAQHARTVRSPQKAQVVKRAKTPPKKIQATAKIADTPQGAVELPPPPPLALPSPSSPVVEQAKSASKVLSLGAKANAQAKKLAASARSKSSQLDKVKKAAAAARQAGDSVGLTKFSEQAAQLEALIQKTQGQAESAARTAEQYGAAAQAASVGAVSGAAAESMSQKIGDFVKTPVGIATVVGGVAVAGYALTRKRSA